MSLLTPQEKQVILFILSGMLLGSVVLLLKGYTPLKIAPELIMVEKSVTLTSPANFIEYPRKNQETKTEPKPEPQPIREKSNARKTQPKPEVVYRQTPALDYINMAGTKGLMMLPGVGKVLADRIIKYREEHGPFGSLDELDKVYGIGKSKVSKIKAFFEKGK